MRAMFVSCILALACAAPSFADDPAISFYVVKKADLRKLIPPGKDVSVVTVEQIEEISLLQGHFKVPCKLYFKKKGYQFWIGVKRIKESDQLSFSLGVHSEEEKTDLSCSEAIEVGETLSVKPDWDSPLSENQYVVLFKKTNLKE